MRGIGSLLATRIIPALAGNTLAISACWPAVRDHPRSRGEYLLAANFRSASSGSSPLSRGIPAQFPVGELLVGIIPALAGNTPRSCPRHPGRRDHPRSRGEYQLPPGLAPICCGSSPLSRGIRATSAAAPPRTRIIPALAGNTSDPPPSARAGRDHPRSRGEYLTYCAITDAW